MPEKKKGRDPYTTLAISLACLVLGIPVGGVALNLEGTPVPDSALASMDPANLVMIPHMAIPSAAIGTMVTAVMTMFGTIMLRHVTPENTFTGIGLFGGAVFNFVVQLVVLALAYISNQVNPVSTSPNDIRFVDPMYQTQRQYTRETWACTMKTLFRDREGFWAVNACSEYHYARYTLIIMVVAAFLFVGISYWPVRRWMFGRRKQMTAMEQLKAAYGKG